jgi:hypothetical protein
MREEPLRFGAEIGKLEKRVEELHEIIKKSGGSPFPN